MMIKTANAAVLHTGWTREQWDKIRRESRSSRIRTAEVDQRLLGRFDPARYLLTHCTIVASVDVQDSPLPLGRFDRVGRALSPGVVLDSLRSFVGKPVIDRRYHDFLVTPETAKYVNDNGDAWERRQLLGTFRTFIGSPNYVEHVQVPELSKGVIVDAVARDIGESVYVDILVATDRKHKDLVLSISRNEMNTLSMGCHVEFTICTHPGCGNVAFDDDQLCDHAKRQKGKNVTDEDGISRIVCELCGHRDAENSNVYIEASWVGNPAFSGAVRRSILAPVEIGKVSSGISLASAIERAEKLRASVKLPDGVTANMAKAASRRRAEFGDDEVVDEASKEEAPKAPADALKKMRDRIKDRIRQDAADELEEELAPPKEPKPERFDLNDNLNASAKEARRRRLAALAVVRPRPSR